MQDEGLLRRWVGASAFALTVFFSVALVGCTAHRSSGRLQAAPPLDHPRVPNPWFADQRRDSLGGLPVHARARAVAELEAGGRVDDDAFVWDFAGPRNIGGRLSSMAVDPNDPDRIWVGAAEGGVFLTEDRGTTWTPMFDSQTALSVGSLASHPTDSSVVYVGTGEETGGGYSYDGEGVFGTTDGGLTWNHLGLAEVRRIPRLAIDPTDPQRIFAAATGGLHHRDAHRGLYRSTDGGTTWEKVLYVQDDAGAVDVAIDPADPSRVFAAMWQRSRADNQSYYGGEASGLYRSTDGGTTWTRLTDGFPGGPDVGRIGIAIAPSDPQVLYASVVLASGVLGGVYRSNDGGDTWTAATTGPLSQGFSDFGYYFGRIVVHPDNPNRVYVLDMRVWESNDAGASFHLGAFFIHPDQHDLAFLPDGSRIIANDGGFYRSGHGGGGYAQSRSLPISQFYGICIDPADPARRLGGTQDNGTIRTGTGGLDDWKSVLPGDGMHCVFDPNDSSRVYAEFQWGLVWRSIDGGQTFSTSVSNGIDSSDRNNWVTPLVHHPYASGVLYTGTHRVYRSVDGALSWTPISGDLTLGPTGDPDDHDDHDHPDLPGADHGRDPIQGTLTTIGVSPVDPNVLWTGSDDGTVWVSEDSGEIWTRVDPPGPRYWVTEIAPDPHHREGAWATHTGYRLGDSLPYVRYTDDLGQTWQDVSGGLPEVPINAVEADPAWRGRLFLASDIGVLLSEDAGNDWALLSAGMPYVVVQDLDLHATSRTLFAGTHGRSMYALDLQQLGPADGDGDGVDNNLDCALADDGAFAPPAEVVRVKIARGGDGDIVLSWRDLATAIGPDVSYSVVRGDLGELRSGNAYGADELACDMGATSTTDGPSARGNGGAFYLVNAKNACGTGPWGWGTDGTERTIAACP